MTEETMPELISDTECYPNFWSIGFYRISDGRILVFEHSARKPLTEAKRDRIRSIMANNRIVGYNFINYDAPMIAVMLDGADNERLKQANDRIIVGGMKPWHSMEVLGVEVPRWDIVDLIEPQPNAFASLKTLMGRMHAEKMQDLPYSPDTALTEEQMDNVLSYMGNDKIGTGMLREFLDEPLALRAAIGAEYGMNVMSKSDAQVGEAIIKRRVEQARGERVYKVDTPGGTTFKYPIPGYLSFEHPDLSVMLARLRSTEFMVQHNGKVELPEWLASAKIAIGETVYQMGIGGLHSTESNRALHSDGERVLRDFDVASYYPAIILNSGLYPKALGPDFLTEYRKIRDERVVAKRRDKEITEVELPALRQRQASTEEERREIKKSYVALDEERQRCKVKAEGLKISLNGCFGKLGSPYSILYAPHLMIAVTLTGQLSLLMLIERAEAAGIPVVSGNTDGVVFHCPVDRSDDLLEITKQWEHDTGFELEETRYRSIYNRSVNDYIAIKEDGSVKWKGVVANPWRSDEGFKPDLRAQLMKNPQMTIIANAVVDLITKGTPIADTIRAGNDVRDFVTVVKVDGGATWRGEYLGKVVRYAWVKDGTEILRAKAHATTGNHGKVPKSDGCRPLMELPDALPDDIDFDAYIAAAEEVLMDIGYSVRKAPVKPLRIFKKDALLWFALAA